MSAAPIHPAAVAHEQLLADCDLRLTRRSGPGGQHRNKVETAVVLRHRATGVEAEANERRSQAENRRVALFRLRVNLAIQVRVAPPVAETPSVLWQSRCVAGRIVVAASHDDFPALLAEALDAISVADADLPAAAAMLGCTSSQLTRLLKKEPRGLALVNRWRAARGLHSLR